MIRFGIQSIAYSFYGNPMNGNSLTDAWRDTGIYPLRMEKLLQNCKQWKNISKGERENIYLKMKTIVKIMMDNGTVLESQYDELGIIRNTLTFEKQKQDNKKRKTKALNEKALRSQRCVQLTHLKQVDERMKKREKQTSKKRNRTNNPQEEKNNEINLIEEPSAVAIESLLHFSNQQESQDNLEKIVNESSERNQNDSMHTNNNLKKRKTN